ncbi:MAG: hypothetical protein IIC22_09455 [Chloroflexi bacterium]|nr:hypothetical protein [Chloroflexota bacterium]
MVFDSGPVFVANRVFDNMEALEKFRDQIVSNPTYRESIEKAAPLRRKDIDIEIFNVLVPPSGENAPRRYVLRSHGYPALGKETLVASIITEVVKSGQAERPYTRLSRQIFGSQGVVFVYGDSFETLAEFENVMINNPSASLQAAAAQVTSLSRAPIVNELYEVLIPFPS